MMIYDMTLQHQAERGMSAAEQRRADEQIGMTGNIDLIG